MSEENEMTAEIPEHLRHIEFKPWHFWSNTYNGNGKWDPGKYLQHRQPEKVIIYDEKVEVKANWDLELVWVVK